MSNLIAIAAGLHAAGVGFEIVNASNREGSIRFALAPKKGEFSVDPDAIFAELYKYAQGAHCKISHMPSTIHNVIACTLEVTDASDLGRFSKNVMNLCGAPRTPVFETFADDLRKHIGSAKMLLVTEDYVGTNYMASRVNSVIRDTYGDCDD